MLEALYQKKLEKPEPGVYKVEHIHIQYNEKVETEVEGKKKKKSKMHLISHLDLTWLVTEGRRAYPINKNTKSIF